MSQTTLRGRFVWHELLTTDPQAAVKFYTQVIGWTTQPWEQNPSYTLWVTERGPVGGVMELPPEAKAMSAPPNWLPYIGTPDLEATVDAAVRLGAKVLRPAAQIPGAGRFAVVADPQGAVFAAYTADSAMEPSDTPQVGDFSWHELATTDGVAAFRFYEQLFGWVKTDAMDMGPSGVYQMFGWGGKSMGGVYTAAKDRPAPPNWLSYIVVPDANQAVERVKRAGGKVLNGPMEVPGGDLIATGLDPQGGSFAVHAVKPVATTKAKASAGTAKAGSR
jgi:predicted enzyme related to lactoylglutathione lyase